MKQARVRSIGPEVDQRAGKRIRRLRAERGWKSHEALSLAIYAMTEDDPDGPKELSPAVLRNMEEGVQVGGGRRTVRRITLGEAVVLARVFDVSIDYIAGLEE